MNAKSTVRGKRPKGPKTLAAAHDVNGQVAATAPEAFTLGEAASFLRVAPDEVRKFAEAGQFSGKKLGGEWRILKSALCAWLSEPEPESEKAYHERLMATAGSMAHDDTAMEMLENIYAERRRHPVSELRGGCMYSTPTCPLRRTN